MSLKREVNATSEVENQPTPCHICLSYDHHVERCPSLPAMREKLQEQVIAPIRVYNSNAK